MNISSTGKNLIKKYEKLNCSVYGDAAGYPTVGWGHLLSKTVYSNYIEKNLPTATANSELKKAGLPYTSPITTNQADSLLTKDLKIAVNMVNNLSCAGTLTQNQFDALTSLIFNYPEAATTHDLITLLHKRETFSNFMGPIDLPAMANLVTSAFRITKAGGRVQNGLINRRNAEMELFCKGMRYSYNKIPNI